MRENDIYLDKGETMYRRLLLIAITQFLFAHNLIAESCVQFTEQVNLQQAVVDRNIEAIRRFNFELRPADIDGWLKQDREAQSKMERAAMDALATISFRQLRNSLNSAKSLNPWVVNKDPLLLQLQKMEKNWNIPTKSLQRTIRDIAKLKEKPVTQKLADEAIAGVGQVRKTVTDANRVSTGDPNAPLKSVATLLGMLVKDPRAGVLVADINLASMIGYYLTANGIARSQIDQIDALTVNDLQSLTALSLQLKTNVRSLSQAKKEAIECQASQPAPPTAKRTCEELQAQDRSEHAKYSRLQNLQQQALQGFLQCTPKCDPLGRSFGSCHDACTRSLNQETKRLQGQLDSSLIVLQEIGKNKAELRCLF